MLALRPIKVKRFLGCWLRCDLLRKTVFPLGSQNVLHAPHVKLLIFYNFLGVSQVGG